MPREGDSRGVRRRHYQFVQQHLPRLCRCPSRVCKMIPKQRRTEVQIYPMQRFGAAVPSYWRAGFEQILRCLTVGCSVAFTMCTALETLQPYTGRI